MWDDLTTEQQSVALAALVLIVVIGIVGVLMVSWLVRAWRRHIVRMRNPQPADGGEPLPDIWKESGDRLVAQMSPYPRPTDEGLDIPTWDDPTDDYPPDDPPEPPDFSSDDFDPDDDDDDDPFTPDRPGPRGFDPDW